MTPVVAMMEAPRRSGGRGERGGAESGNSGEAEKGLADHLRFPLGLLDWFIRTGSRRPRGRGSRYNVSQRLNGRSALPLSRTLAISRRLSLTFQHNGD